MKAHSIEGVTCKQLGEAKAAPKISTFGQPQLQPAQLQLRFARQTFYFTSCLPLPPTMTSQVAQHANETSQAYQESSVRASWKRLHARRQAANAGDVQPDLLCNAD